MSATLVLTSSNEILRTVSEAPMTREQRDAERRILSTREDVVLFEIIPTHHEELSRYAWGYCRSAEREEKLFTETATRMMKQ